MAPIRLSYLPLLLLAATTTAGVTELTDSNFDALTKAMEQGNKDPWLVKFHAPWCGHCKRLVPTWDSLSNELKGRVNVAKVDCVGSGGDTCTRFHIRGYPTLKLLVGGKAYDYVGARTEFDIKRFATGDYTKHKAHSVPPPLTLWDKFYTPVADAFAAIGAEFKGMINDHPMALAGTLAAGFGLGALFVSFLWCLFSWGPQPEGQPVDMEEEEEEKEGEGKEGEGEKEGEDKKTK